MDPIPMPQILDPERLLFDDREEFTGVDHRQRADQLADALKESCDYGQRLWHQLDAVRAYLLDSAPPDTTSGADGDRTGAQPTGPQDDDGWAAWTQAYASVTTSLMGERGDNGYGEQEARREAEHRRAGSESG